MIKAATTSLSLAILITFAASVPAQMSPGSDADSAVQEAVRRQAFTVELRQHLAEARTAAQSKNFPAAGKLYEMSYALCQKIGSGVDAETKTAVEGVVSVRTELAREAQQHGDYKDADAQIRSALRDDPKNQNLIALKKSNDNMLAAQAGRIPSTETVEKVPGIITNSIKAATLVQDGKLLYELGKWDEAEIKLKQAIAADPANKTSAYYLSLIEEARFRSADRNRELMARKSIVDIEDAWMPPVKRDTLPKPNASARTEIVHTGTGRQAILAKLDKIQLSDVKYDNMELGVVVGILAGKIKDVDPDKVGINFLVLSDAATPTAQPGAVDANGLPITTAASEQVDLGTVRVKIGTPLNGVRLADVLDAIVKTAERPIKYSVEDYAVVFSSRQLESTPLSTRQYKIDPNTFSQGLESVQSVALGSAGGGKGGGGGQGGQAAVARVNPAGAAGGGGGGRGGGGGGGGISFVTKTNSMEAVQETVRAFFRAAGVDFPRPNDPSNGKTMFFNDRRGILFVRATLADLDIIDAAIQVLNVAPPMVNIKARIMEIKQADSRALGFNWYLGNTLLGSGTAGVQGGTAPSFSGAPSSANPTGVFPGPFGAGTVFPATTDNLISQGLRNVVFTDATGTGQKSANSSAAPSLATVTGILTDPQFRMVINALDQRDGVDLLSAPELTTMSGRQAQVEVADVLTIVVGTDVSQTASSNAIGSTITYTTETLPFGPLLDV
ncbi:MAG: hypothetical protein RLZZ350_1139, partial [Verrucomicrobiota bacterium]